MFCQQPEQCSETIQAVSSIHCLWTFSINRKGTSQSQEAGGSMNSTATVWFTKWPAELFPALPGTIPVEQKKSLKPSVSEECSSWWQAIKRYLLHYLPSCWPHSCLPFHGFVWYHFCRMEKWPLAVNGSCQQEWSLESIPAGSKQSSVLVNSAVACLCNGSRTHGWGWYIVYKSSSGKMRNSSGGCEVLPDIILNTISKW